MDSAAIGGQAIARRLEGFEGDLEDRVRLAMERAWTDDTWYTASSDEKLRAALYGVLVSLDKDSEDWTTMKQSIDMMRDLNALLSGLPVDAEAVTSRYEGVDTVPLAGLWQEYVEKDKAKWSRLATVDDGGDDA